MYVAMCLYAATVFIGSSGDVFPNLSVGSHTMTIRFTPDGYCQSLMDQLSLDFNIAITRKNS